jgi:hypothetical protein
VQPADGWEAEPVIGYEGLVSEQRCPGCGETKPLEDFVRNTRARLNHGKICRECDRERSRRYYRLHRDKVLAKAAVRRGPRPTRYCSECGVELEPPKRVVCGQTCRERRFKRLHPESYERREKAKVVRRREARRRAKATSPAAT